MVTQTIDVFPQVEVRQSVSKVQGRIVTTKVAGVSFEDRQEVLAKLHIGDWVWLEQEPDNPFDPNAIMVSRNNREQIGYINRFLAAHLVRYFDFYGQPVRGRVALLTGSSYDGYSLGAVIRFKIPGMMDKYRNHQKHQIDLDD